jgi:hypothetical protein
MNKIRHYGGIDWQLFARGAGPAATSPLRRTAAASQAVNVGLLGFLSE